ncbi:hypothetical protein AVDCRST_MAG84-7077 [uncultured Microcoleus sp.]|uniref:Uncharacterized protein n=1 Tax=uncultured Microcoleus sp. TaxID=259945 RepID=A0A6J4PUC8_9CYAN|nr:hypothetical protein AVDCRST_MAG84-7077 [uncultured Microcoleus sp.]
MSCGGFSSADLSRRVIKKFGKWVPGASLDRSWETARRFQPP